MTTIKLEVHEDIIMALNKAIVIQDEGIEFEIPQGSILLDNVMNLKLLKQLLEEKGKVVHFYTEDENGNRLLDSMDSVTLNTKTINISDQDAQKSITNNTKDSLKNRLKLKFAKKAYTNKSTSESTKNIHNSPEGFIGSGITNTENISNRNRKTKKQKHKNKVATKVIRVLIILLIILGGIAGGVYAWFTKNHEAFIDLTVSSKPFTRSFTLKVTSNETTDIPKAIINGTTIMATEEKTVKVETTGEKIVGGNAKGEITVYNKTTEEKTLKKGTKVAYKGKDKDYVYELSDNITVPALSPENPADPGSALIPGKATVKVKATGIGDEYNISKGETLELEDYKKAEMTAESNTDFEGGYTKSIKIVTQADIDKATNKVIEDITDTLKGKIKEKLSKNQKLIEGSLSIKVTKTSSNKNIGDEAKEVEVTQKVQAQALAYNTKTLEEAVSRMIEALVPENNIIYEKDKDIRVEVLGNSTDSVLNAKEADIQVTIRTHTIPDIKEDELKKQVAGLSMIDARDSIIETIGRDKVDVVIKVQPLSIITTLPKDTNKIHISVVRK